jgi:hypothetical protein
MEQFSLSNNNGLQIHWTFFADFFIVKALAFCVAMGGGY